MTSKEASGFSPSKERRGDYIFCYCASDRRRNSEKASAWSYSNGAHYRQSGRLWPRNIFQSGTIEPTTSTQRFLLAVDQFAYDALGKRPRWLGGKWVVYADRDEVDEAWATVCTSIEKGRLRYGAKVSTAKLSRELERHLSESYQHGRHHVILVYTPNFLWRQNVKEVRRILASIGFRQKLYYKPTFFTDPDILPSALYWDWIGKICNSALRYRYFG